MTRLGDEQSSSSWHEQKIVFEEYLMFHLSDKNLMLQVKEMNHVPQ